MTEFVIYIPNEREKVNSVFTRGTTKLDFLEFMQYAIDNMTTPEKLILENLDNHVTYDAYRIATEHYGMRKRTPAERLNNVTTYHL